MDSTTLAQVTETPEVRAYKEALYREATALAQRNGWTREARTLLRQLGIQGPGAVTINGTVTLQVSLDATDVFHGQELTTEQVRERLAGYSPAQLAREAFNRADLSQATVTYTVTEPTAPSAS